jgi:GNAT superfamily N-acetyltransferase
VRGKPLPSAIALEPNSEQLIGVALFLENRESHADLDLLFVKPTHQRQGIATQMVTSVANILYKDGVRELRSTYHICNDRSCAWQHKYGFEDIPEPYYCRLKYSWYRNEIWRSEQLGLSDRFKELERERDKWYELLEDDWKY